MTNGIGKHGHAGKKAEATPKRTVKTAAAATLKKAVRKVKRPKTK